MARTITRPITISDETEMCINALQKVFDGFNEFLENVDPDFTLTELERKIVEAKDEALKMLGYHIERSMQEIRKNTTEAIVI